MYYTWKSKKIKIEPMVYRVRVNWNRERSFEWKGCYWFDWNFILIRKHQINSNILKVSVNYSRLLYIFYNKSRMYAFQIPNYFNINYKRWIRGIPLMSFVELLQGSTNLYTQSFQFEISQRMKEIIHSEQYYVRNIPVFLSILVPILK